MTRRRSFDRTRKTNSTWNVAVGTVKKSTETISLAWFFRNVRQLWEGGFKWRTIYFETVAWLTTMPSFSNSP
jgi:hypothetical protein